MNNSNLKFGWGAGAPPSLTFLGWGVMGDPPVKTLDVRGYVAADYWDRGAFLGPDVDGVVPVYITADGDLFPTGAKLCPTSARGNEMLILIDSNSGFVWGAAPTNDPARACQIVDEQAGIFARLYQDIGPRAGLAGRPGYLVYEAPDTFEVTDGQDPSVISRVAEMPLVTKIVWGDRQGDPWR